jgi:hypothetical protein
MDPVLSREVEEGEQGLGVVGDLAHRLGVLGRVGLDEGGDG